MSESFVAKGESMRVSLLSSAPESSGVPAGGLPLPGTQAPPGGQEVKEVPVFIYQRRYFSTQEACNRAHLIDIFRVHAIPEVQIPKLLAILSHDINLRPGLFELGRVYQVAEGHAFLTRREAELYIAAADRVALRVRSVQIFE